jgi:hypothetical protein
MKTKAILTAVLLSGSSSIVAQTLFERVETYVNDPGDITSRDVIVSTEHSPDDVITTGYYIADQGMSNENDKVILTNHDLNGSVNFKFTYQHHTSGSPYNSRAYSLVESDTGFIVVGSTKSNTYYSTSVPGGGDILAIRCDKNGVVINAKRYDLGYNEVAYSIIPKDNDFQEYLICGSVITDTSRMVFVMEINEDLSVNWLKHYDLRLTAGTPAYGDLYDLVLVGTDIWAVGSLGLTSSTGDGLVIKLNSTGTLQSARRVVISNSITDELTSVDYDGSRLVMSGFSSRLVVGSGIQKRMIALKYNQTNNTVVNALHLKGYHGTMEDIDYMNNGTLTGYRLVGYSTPASGSSKGVMYCLNSSFRATHRYEFSGNSNVKLYAVKDHDTGSEEFLANAGLYETSGFERALIAKSTIYGSTGCSDSLARDTVSLSADTASVWSYTYTAYTPVSIDIQRDTLKDSLLCSSRTPFALNNFQDNDGINDSDLLTAYPNPVPAGGDVVLELSESIAERSLRVYSSSGELIEVSIVRNGQSGYRLGTSGLAPGLYFVVLQPEGVNDSDSNMLMIKLVVQ